MVDPILLRAELNQLRLELSQDVQLATTRVQHIRLQQRIARVDLILEMMLEPLEQTLQTVELP